MDPTGGGMGMDASVLAGSPFPDFLIPGMVLLAVNGLGSLVGALASFAGCAAPDCSGPRLGRSCWPGSSCRSPSSGSITGSSFALGALELGLGLWLRARTEEKP